MQNIPLSLAAAGMIVAKEIKSSDDPASLTVCGKGVKLSESLIDRLKHLGIQAITVEGHPVTVEGESTLEEMLTALDRRFRRVEDDPLMMKLKAIYQKHLQRSMGVPDGK